MSYDNPQRECYDLGLVDYAAAVLTTSFQGPLGKKRRLKDCEARCTEVFNEVTTSAFLQLGTSGDADKYAKFNFQSTAATDTFRASADDISVATTGIIDADLPADTQIEVVSIQNTGGTPTGIARTQIIVDWY